MSGSHGVSEHYTSGGLVGRITAGVASLGKSIDTVTVDDLAPVDEFHIGGRQASEEFLSQLGLTAEKHVLDIGCGLGGAARFVSSRYDCRVTGVDLTSEFVETGREMCRWVGLERNVSLQQGSALDMPFGDAEFDSAYMLHVGMNIEDKEHLGTEVARVIKSGSLFGVYDIMRTGQGELLYPVPWAAHAGLSSVVEPGRYKTALEAAGFEVVAERNRRDFALDFFHALQTKTQFAGGPPPLGLHLLMGATAAEKIGNMVENIRAGRIAPVEMIARKS
ncbi:MAG: class I SAM-dependent methyltransferase [Hyphomicrobiaceae bacterium]